MSALGQKQTFEPQKVMSALPPKADMCGALAHVCFGPIADIPRFTRGVEPRLGVLMNPYTGAAPQLFVSEPFNNTIAVINLVVFGTPPNQVLKMGSQTSINSPSLNFPVDLAPVQRDVDNANWASNTTLDDGSDFYVANRGNNTIVRMKQDGTVVAVRRVTLAVAGNANLNGNATSTDGTTIYVTITGPGHNQGGVLALPAF
jgi:hypothetical protein